MWEKKSYKPFCLHLYMSSEPTPEFIGTILTKAGIGVFILYISEPFDVLVDYNPWEACYIEDFMR